MKRIILKPGEEDRIPAGHPWVYDNEVAAILAGPGESTKTELESGECAEVESSPKGRRQGGSPYLGRAIVNPHSHIIARIYSPSKEGLDKGFFKRRIREAIERRLQAGYDLADESARIVFGEADFLPGLIIDRYVGQPANPDDGSSPRQSWLCIQFLAYGMDRRREMILEALNEVLAAPLRPNQPSLGVPSGILEKSAPVRELEGLPPRDGLISGSFPPEGMVITEKPGILFTADLAGGQKTGHFLDQSDNHRRAAELALLLRSSKPETETEPLRVLDCFCYTGGFSLHLARAAPPQAAVSIIAVDASAAALDLVRKNAALNGAGDCIQTLEADVFDFLRQQERRGELFDLIVLDPPAFAKSRSALEGAVRGYKEINLRAIKLLKKGGLLISCSCSYALNEDRFKRIIAEAAADSGRRLVQLDFRGQAPDHPILLGYDESAYLKCGFYRVVSG
jgi:23S rRNA (cytosine1962-C5)-methyltransferase